MAINAVIRFLQAARSMAKQGMKKEQILDFARREFGKVSELLKRQIDDIYSRYKKPKTEKKGEVVPIKKKEGIETLSEADQDIADIQKSIDELDATEAAADADAAKEIVKKRTKDIAKGDVEEGGIDTLETSIKKLKEAAEELKKTTIKPEGIMETIVKSQRAVSYTHLTLPTIYSV